MQKIATRIFITASLAFGVLGILMVLTGASDGPSGDKEWLVKSFMVSVFVILPSFALSVATKYLNGKQ